MDSELHKRLRASFRWVDPGPASTHLVSDRSGWWRDPEVLARVGPALAALFPDVRPTVVVAPEVTGFLVGPLVAAALGVGFVEAYKDGRRPAVPAGLTWASTELDYRNRRLHLGVRNRHLTAADRVLLVDDWVATGAQLRALREVVAVLGAHPVGAAAIVAECPARVTTELRLRTLLTTAELPVQPSTG